MRPMKAMRVLLGCTALLLRVGAARADAVPPPPPDCLEGTEGQTCHGGPYCSPKVCAEDADCGAGKVCQPRQLCVAEINCGGGWEPDPEPALAQNVVGTCEGGAACGPPASCVALRVCGPSSGTGSAGGAAGGSSTGRDDVTITGCDCAVGAASGAPAAGLAALLAGAALLAARRRSGATSRAHRAPPSGRSRSRQRRA